MAEEVPLLQDQLTQNEQIALAALYHQPGYKVLEKLIRAAVDVANAKVMKVDPASLTYSRELAAKQQEARATNIFAKSVLKTVVYHTEFGKKAAVKEDVDLLARINAVVK